MPLELNGGVIVAKRHIRMTKAEAAEMGVVDNQIDSEDSSPVFGLQ